MKPVRVVRDRDGDLWAIRDGQSVAVIPSEAPGRWLTRPDGEPYRNFTESLLAREYGPVTEVTTLDGLPQLPDGLTLAPRGESQPAPARSGTWPPGPEPRRSGAPNVPTPTGDSDARVRPVRDPHQ